MFWKPKQWAPNPHLKFSSDEYYKRISAKCWLIISYNKKTNKQIKALQLPKTQRGEFHHSPQSHLLPAVRWCTNSLPFPSQVAVRRRTSARIKSHTRWRRQRHVPALSFCPSPTGTGLIASSQANQLPAQ